MRCSSSGVVHAASSPGGGGPTPPSRCIVEGLPEVWGYGVIHFTEYVPIYPFFVALRSSDMKESWWATRLAWKCDKRTLGLVLCLSFGLSLALVSSGIVPAFTEGVARSVNVVHVVDTTGIDGGNREPLSYISLYSNTRGKFIKELVDLGDEQFFCGRNMAVDFVTFTMKYDCWSYKESSTRWSKSEVPYAPCRK